VAIPAPKETDGPYYNERDIVLLKGIGRVCGVGKDLT